MTAGADGYVLKRSSRAALVHAVREVAQGRSVLAPEVTRAVLAKARARPSQSPVQLQPFRLTPCEQEILALVGKGLSNQEITEHLTLSEHTVKTHLTSVLSGRRVGTGPKQPSWPSVRASRERAGHPGRPTHDRPTGFPGGRSCQRAAGEGFPEKLFQARTLGVRC